MFQFWKRITGDRTALSQQMRAALAASEALTPDEAERRALDLLADPSRYAVEAGEATVPAGVPPTVRRLFSRYRSIRALRDDLEIGVDLVSSSNVKAGLTTLGFASEHTYVTVHPTEETIYILADDVASNEAVESTHPSVFHYLVYRDLLDCASAV
jgi:hypothetical protein